MVSTAEKKAYELRVQELLASRRHGIKVMQERLARQKAEKTEESLTGLRAAQEVLRKINVALAEQGEISRKITGCGVAKTKSELIGSLLSWSDQMRDSNKNPATPPAEKLFNQRAIDRITMIIGKGQES